MLRSVWNASIAWSRTILKPSSACASSTMCGYLHSCNSRGHLALAPGHHSYGSVRNFRRLNLHRTAMEGANAISDEPVGDITLGGRSNNNFFECAPCRRLPIELTVANKGMRATTEIHVRCR